MGLVGRLAGLLFIASGCGVSQSPATAAEASDGDASYGHASDGSRRDPVEGSFDGDAAISAASDASPGCPESLAAYCAMTDASPGLGDRCDPTLSAALTRTACSLGASFSRLSYSLFKGCGSLDALYLTVVDGGSIEYFDSATGNLVAFAEYTANFGGREECVAGPADFVPPQCPTTPSDPSCPDAAAPCQTASDCPPTAGGDCGYFCADGSEYCAPVCVSGSCALRGCPDGG